MTPITTFCWRVLLTKSASPAWYGSYLWGFSSVLLLVRRSMLFHHTKRNRHLTPTVESQVSDLKLAHCHPHRSAGVFGISYI